VRVVVIGASGNAGTSTLAALERDAEIESVLAVARRPAAAGHPKTEWRAADVRGDDLAPALRGADAVIHLAWLIQPSHDASVLWAANVDGSARVFRAAREAGVSALVYASSVGAYSPGPKDRRVDEGWPTDGISSSLYSMQKAEVERLLDRFERESPGVRVVRIRPALIFKREAAAEIRRFFIGPFVPRFAVRAVPVVPDLPRLRVQAVHADDVGEAYRLAVAREAHGAFNIAADPVLGVPELARILGARPAPIPTRVLRRLIDVSWRLRLQPTSAGWFDMGLAVPLMDASRARDELGWTPRHSADWTLEELLDGLRHGAGAPTPPLDPHAGGPLRVQEIKAGVGGTNEP
jgi:nucleoside-diphosphate-sugar epimerase